MGTTELDSLLNLKRNSALTTTSKRKKSNTSYNIYQLNLCYFYGYERQSNFFTIWACKTRYFGMPLVTLLNRNLKLVSAIFYQIFIFQQMIALEKLWKLFSISSKKLFSFSRYSNFCIPVSPLFLPVSPCFKGCRK